MALSKGDLGLRRAQPSLEVGVGWGQGRDAAGRGGDHAQAHAPAETGEAAGVEGQGPAQRLRGEDFTLTAPAGWEAAAGF